MRKIFLLFFNFIIISFYLSAQTDTWSGNLEIQGMKLPLIFHLNSTNPTMDSPAQGAIGIPISVSKTDPDSISINIHSIGAIYKGRYTDEEITGIFTQRGISLPLILKPGIDKPKRPQTPLPPFPYIQEDVSFSNGDAVLKGTLTLPAECTAETPVVLMVTGSGLQNRDEELFEHKPFAVIADKLARNGIASLRYDDRGFGESTGDVVNCTTNDLMLDAQAGLDMLRKRFNNVGILGHSEGGTIAFMLGAKNKPDFIISLAGMVISGKETLLDQNKYTLTNAGYSEKVVNQYCELLTSCFDYESDFMQKLEISDLPIELKKNLQIVNKQISTPYMKYFLTTDVSSDLKDIRCPVLALNGTKDIQVSADKNLGMLNDRLQPGNFNRIIPLKGLNHMFQHCETGAPAEYSVIEETISPEVLDIIVNWILTTKR